MPTQIPTQDTEAAELREKLWTFTQRGLVMLVIFVAGLLVGFVSPLTIAPVFRPLGIAGPAAELEDQVDHLNEKTQTLTKERDTLRSQIAIVERDMKEVERKLLEAEARAAGAARAAAPANQ